jgi:hypothetical protein
VIVENCIDDNFDADLHLAIDEFFNQGLNQFNVPCVRQHRRAMEWRDILARYGSVSHVAELHRVPGIPFPYTLFNVEIDAS